MGSFPETYNDPQLLPGRRVILPAESALASVHMRNTFHAFAQANSSLAFSDYLALTELTWLGKPKC